MAGVRETGVYVIQVIAPFVGLLLLLRILLIHTLFVNKSLLLFPCPWGTLGSLTPTSIHVANY